jgi:hypothetical protein
MKILLNGVDPSTFFALSSGQQNTGQYSREKTIAKFKEISNNNAGTIFSLELGTRNGS